MGGALGEISQQSQTHTAAGPGRTLHRGELARCVSGGGDSGELESPSSEGDSHLLAPPANYHVGTWTQNCQILNCFFSKRGQVSRF